MTSPRPAIIGTGRIGSALARLFDRAGVEVDIANTRGPDSIRDLADSIGPAVHPVPLDEALGSDLILLAIPFGAVEQFGTVLPDWGGKTVIDVTNAPASGSKDDAPNGQPSSQFVADHLPGATIVKAFNQLPATTLQAEVDPAIGRLVVFLATDADEAGDRVEELVGRLGLSAVRIGRIDQGGRLIQVPNALVLRRFVERPLA